MKRFLISIAVLAALLSSCKSTENTGLFDIPALTVEKPSRPYLEGTYEEMVRTLIQHVYELEAYSLRLEEYILAISEILG